MKFPKLIAVICLIVSILQSTVFAREIEKYKGEITVPIVENDNVYARNNAFQSLQRLLLSSAIQDLIGQELYQEYKEEINRNKTLNPSNFLVSAKVLREFSRGDQFTMELEGIIQLSALAEELRKMNMIMKDDPWIQVSVVVQDGLKLPIAQLKERLSIFHVNISTFDIYHSPDITYQERATSAFIELLYSKFPRAKIIYYIDTMPDEANFSAKAIRAQIFRKSDFSLISSIKLDIPDPISSDSIDNTTFSHFFRLFNIDTLEADLYNEGKRSTIVLKVEGLIDPFNRHIFEQDILKSERSIKSYTLTQISSEQAEYQVEAGMSLEELTEFFTKKNDHFYFITEKEGPSTLLVESFYRYSNSSPELTEWEPDQRILDLISETVNQDSPQTNSESNNNLLFQNTVQEQYIPRFIEKEPNNNSLNLNNIPPSTLILGYISSRADEDVFRLKRNVDSTTLVVEWIRIGKTTLSPQLRLYDQHFNFINNYSLVGHQHKLKFQYTFKDTPPHQLFLRITDKVGFIQGETGGFKSFYYLLKYYWQGGKI